jgi:glycosyltransferase domain-containing protein
VKNNISKTAIIIPTHDRHENFSKIFEYWATINYDVYICDSSINKYLGNIPDFVEYLHLPEYSFSKKILYLLNNSDYDTYGMCADDDILVETTLNNAIKHLTNKDYLAYFGGTITYIHADNTFKIFSKPHPIKGDNDNLFIRVDDYFRNHQQILWGVYKKRILIKAFTYLDKQNFSNDNLLEISLASIILYYGKIFITGDYLNIREMADNSWGRRVKTLSFANYISNKNVKLNIHQYSNSIDEITQTNFGQKVFTAYWNISYAVKIKIIVKHFIKKTLIIFHLGIIIKLLNKHYKCDVTSKQVLLSQLFDEESFKNINKYFGN